MISIEWAPGAVTAGTNIDIPAGAAKISGIISAEIFRGSDGTAAAAKVAATATKVDEDTITLDVDTTALDLLVLRYNAIGEILSP